MNAHAKPSEIAATAKPLPCVPQGYDRLDEIVAIRKLLRLGRADEAKTRLDIWLDRYRSGWRTVA